MWFWQNDQFSIYHWHEYATQFKGSFGYEAITHSELLPDLDMILLTQCVLNLNPLATAKAFCQGIQEQRSGMRQ